MTRHHRFLIRHPTIHEQVHPESDLHSAGALHGGRKCPPTILDFLLRRVQYCYSNCFISFSLNHGNSDLSAKTRAKRIMSESTPLAYKFTFHDLTKKINKLLTPQTEVEREKFFKCVSSYNIPFISYWCFPNNCCPSIGRWWSWHITYSVTCSPSPMSFG